MKITLLPFDGSRKDDWIDYGNGNAVKLSGWLNYMISETNMEWLIELILSAQSQFNQLGTQIWELDHNGNSYTLTCQLLNGEKVYELDNIDKHCPYYTVNLALDI